MELARTAEQRDLAAVLRDFVAAQQAEDVARRALDDQAAFDHRTWKRLVELGVLDPVLPIGLGGEGGGMRDLVVVAEELGRGPLCAPFLPVAGLVAGLLLPEVERDPAGVAAELLCGIVTNGTVATVAWLPAGGRWENSSAFGCRAEQVAGTEGWVLSGTTDFVPFGVVAEVVLVPAATPKGPAVLAVDGDAVGLTREPLTTLDATRPAARLTFDGVAARLAVPADAGADLERGLDRAGVLLAAEQLGTAERAMETAIEYASLRTQFGRVIGSFQSIKHLCADMYIGVESLRSAVRAGAWAIDADAPARAVFASLAQALGSQVAAAVTDASLHVHGGIGFTWEHTAHLYLRRALGDATLLGDSDHHLARLADRAAL